jgi:hypothetical protein
LQKEEIPQEDGGDVLYKIHKQERSGSPTNVDEYYKKAEGMEERTDMLFLTLFLPHDPGKYPAGFAVTTLKLGKFLVEILCLTRDIFGDDNLYPDQEIAMFPAPLDTFPGNPECGIVLDARRNLQIDMPFVDRLYLDICPQDSQGRRDLDRCFKIIPGALKAFVGEYVHLDEEIPIGRTIVPGLAIPFHTQAHPVVHTGRYMDRDFSFDPCVTRPVTFAALPLRDLAPAAAHRARGHPHELAED